MVRDQPLSSHGQVPGFTPFSVKQFSLTFSENLVLGGPGEFKVGSWSHLRKVMVGSWLDWSGHGWVKV